MLIKASSIISRSFGLLKDNFVTYLKYIALYLVISLVGGGLTTVLFAGAFVGGRIGGPIVIAIAGLIAAIAMFATMIILFIAQLAFIKAVSQLDKEEKEKSIKENMLASKSVFWKTLGVMLLVSLYVSWPLIIISLIGVALSMLGLNSDIVSALLSIASIGAVVYVVYYTIKLYFSYYRVVLDGAKVMDAINYSKKQVSGNWWSILWRLFAPAFVFFIITFVAQIVFGSVSTMVDNVAISGLSSSLLAIVSIFVAPLYPTAQVILYNNLEGGSEEQGESEDTSQPSNDQGGIENHKTMEEEKQESSEKSKLEQTLEK